MFLLPVIGVPAPRSNRFSSAVRSGANLAEVVTGDRFSWNADLPLRFGALARVPEGATPSPAFVAQVEVAGAEVIRSLPDDLRGILSRKDFGFSVFRHPAEYLDKIQTLDELVPPEALDAFLKVTNGQAPGLDPAVLKQQLLKVYKQGLMPAFAFYLVGQPTVNVHETYEIPLALRLFGGYKKAIPPLSRILRHELGHYVESLTGLGMRRAMMKPRFRQLLFEDLDQAIAQGLIPMRRTPKGLYEAVPDGGQWQQSVLGHPVTIIPEHFSYYVPGSPQDYRALPEAFAEIFAGNFGGGMFPNTRYFRDQLFPKTSAWMRNELLPELYRQFS
jgi:hypothetical protein